MIREQLAAYFQLEDHSDEDLLSAIEQLTERRRFTHMSLVAFGTGGIPVEKLPLKVQS